MEYYDHAMLGATVGLATGTPRRYGPAIVAMASLAGTITDWDAVPYPSGSEYYLTVHRVWGHNLFVAPLLSGLVGAVGYLCWRSIRRSDISLPGKQGHAAHPLAVWIMVGVLASLSHVLTDLCYCGTGKVEWPVVLFWPLSKHGWGLPLVSFTDRGVTWILGVTLIAACLRPRLGQMVGILGLLVVMGYIAVYAVVPTG